MDEIDYKWKEIRDEIEELYKIHQNFPAYWEKYKKFLPIEQTLPIKGKISEKYVEKILHFI